MRKPLRTLYLSVVLFAGLGLASGLYYRELTRTLEFTGDTQLATAHTHFLALGLLLGLSLLLLEHAFRLSESTKLFTWTVGLWHAGVILTAGMQVFKGTLQVLGSEAATSKAIAGVSGLGHMILTAMLVVLFIVLGKRLKVAAPADEEVAVVA